MGTASGRARNIPGMKPRGHLVAHLETACADMRGNVCMYVTGIRAGLYHHVKSILHNTVDGAAPSGMNSRHYMRTLVGQQQRQTIGRIHADSHAWQSRDYRVNAIKTISGDRDILY